MLMSDCFPMGAHSQQGALVPCNVCGAAVPAEFLTQSKHVQFHNDIIQSIALNIK